MAEKYWYGGAVNHKGDWSFGGIAPFNLNAGRTLNVNGFTGLPASGNTLTPGDPITITGSGLCDGTYNVDASTTADTIVLPIPYSIISGTDSLVMGTQWSAAMIDLHASGVQPGMKLKLWDETDTLIGITLSGTDGLANGTAFSAAMVDFTLCVQPGMKVKLWGSAGTFLGEFAIISIVDAATLEIEDTGLSQAGLHWEIQVRDPATFEGFSIISVIDSGTLEVEQTCRGESGLRYEIVRSETFDGTETVTYNGGSNWKHISDGTNAPKPVDGDVIHFNDRAYFLDSENKYQGCTINVDAQGTGTPNLAGVFVSAGFNSSIGSASKPLEVNCQGKDVVVDGPCKVYLRLSAGEAADAGCGRLVVNNDKASVFVSSYLNNVEHVCLYDLLVCLKGALWIRDNAAVKNILAANYNAIIDGGIGIEDVKNGTLCSITAVKGEITWRSKLDQVELFDAKFAWGDYGMVEVTDYACNLLTIYSKSGEFMWQMADSGYSVIKKILLYAGNLTASQAVNSGYQKRIGTSSEISELWPDAVANFNSSSNNVLIAPGSKLEAHGGTLIASCGSLLGW
jgi:hypothetical protein